MTDRLRKEITLTDTGDMQRVQCDDGSYKITVKMPEGLNAVRKMADSRRQNFLNNDAVLLKEMNNALACGEASSITDAALSVADRARTRKGASVESVVSRLVKGYKKTYRALRKNHPF